MSSKKIRKTKTMTDTQAPAPMTLDQQFNAIVGAHPLAVTTVATMRTIVLLTGAIEKENPGVDALIQMNLFVGNFFSSLGEQYLKRVETLIGEKNKARSAAITETLNEATATDNNTAAAEVANSNSN